MPTIRALALSCLCLLTFLDAREPYCYFVPPKQWEVADPKLLLPRVKIAFLGADSGRLRPTITLAIDEVRSSENDYLKAAKQRHETNKQSTWRNLGQFRTSAGNAHLTEIETRTPLGTARLMQLLLVQEEKAYILTAIARKEAFAKHYQEFQDAFRSLTLVTDLTDAIPDAERKAQLQMEQDQLLRAWKIAAAEGTSAQQFVKESAFQAFVLSRFSDLGAHWQALLLQATQAQLLSGIH